MRKAHWNTAPGVPRLDYSVDRGPSATSPVVVATALQSRPATHIVRTRLSGSAAALPRAGATPAASLRPAQPRRGSPRLERTSPRVPPLRPRGMTIVVFLRTTNGCFNPDVQLFGATPLTYHCDTCRGQDHGDTPNFRARAVVYRHCQHHGQIQAIQPRRTTGRTTLKRPASV